MLRNYWQSLVLLPLALSLIGCSSMVSPTVDLEQFLKLKGLEMIHVDTASTASVSKQKGASISVSFKFPQMEESFKTQLARSVSADLQSFKVYLLSDNTATPTVVAGPLVINKSPLLTSGGQVQKVTFTDVVQGTYYAGVSAYASLGGTGLNITSPTGSCLISTEACYISNAGGDGTGSVSVGPAPTYTVSNTTPLSMTLNLCNC